MLPNYNKLITYGAVVALIGFITSGPLGFMMVKLTRP